MLGIIALNLQFRIGYNHISQVSVSRVKEIGSFLTLLLFMFKEVLQTKVKP